MLLVVEWWWCGTIDQDAGSGSGMILINNGETKGQVPSLLVFDFQTKTPLLWSCHDNKKSFHWLHATTVFGMEWKICKEQEEYHLWVATGREIFCILHGRYQKVGKGGSDQEYQYRTDVRIIMIDLPRARRLPSSWNRIIISPIDR
jgi:hypothetical protein